MPDAKPDGPASMGPWQAGCTYTRIACAQALTQTFDVIDGLGSLRSDASGLGAKIDNECVRRDVPQLERVLCGAGAGCCICTACLSWLPFCAVTALRASSEIDQYSTTAPLPGRGRTTHEHQD
eukprot:TRINITY_DN7742_c0_g1_i1.p1 TRINITY_DN7742_c0_g1~~TRINITY_DN7742_c0_g1_i1.p1  ORF type:complete len:143 (+),score=46.29 TRINITY_DN7742_c0_g1_i1:63-431(+)